MKKVLIVEDEPRIRSMYCDLLTTCGMEVREASNAWEAADTLISEKLDLVLLDLKLPCIDGKDFFDMIREHDPNMKIIISSVQPIEKQKQLVPGALAYFDKSHGTYALLEKVNDVLN